MTQLVAASNTGPTDGFVATLPQITWRRVLASAFGDGKRLRPILPNQRELPERQ